MFPVSFKGAMKKILHYNARRNLKAISGTGTSSASEPGPSTWADASEVKVSIEKGGELELSVLPSTYFEC